MMDAAQIIATLGLAPHPEGGWYAETLRDNPTGGRGHSTAIYFLLERGQKSRWHRVTDAVEVWHFYAGAPLVLEMGSSSGPSKRTIIGANIIAGERPQAVVPSGWWQRAHSTGEWTLVGCTVAPGFEFSSFEMAGPEWEPDQPLD